MSRPIRFLLLPVLPAAAAGALLFGPGAAAQGPGKRTLTLTESQVGATFKHIRNTKPRNRRANLAGDVIVFTNPMLDASGAKVGRLFVSCATTLGSRNFEKSVLTCNGVIELADGTMTLQANTRPGVEETVGAITGGTGAYANVHGTLTSKTSVDTITLAP